MYCLAILQTNCIDIYFLAHREILFGLPPAPLASQESWTFSAQPYLCLLRCYVPLYSMAVILQCVPPASMKCTYNDAQDCSLDLPVRDLV